MKLQTLIFLLATRLALCQTTNVTNNLISVLQENPDTQGFGDLLEEFPDLITNLNATKQYTVFAPSNDAVAAFRASLNSSGTLDRRTGRLNRRSIPTYAARIALLFTDRSNQANLNTQPTDLITNLTDPAFINITPASTSASLTQSSSSTSSSSSSIQSTSSSAPSSTSTVLPTTSSAPAITSSTALTTASSIQSPTSRSSSSPPPATTSPALGPTFPQGKMITSGKKSRRQSGWSSGNGTITVFTGFGKTAIASTTETPYCMGAIRATDDFFTLFGDLPTTLAQTNGTAFSAALSQANILTSLSNTPRITVFVPNDAALQGQTLDATALKQYILFDTLATTTTLGSGGLTSSSGQNVNVTVSADGTYTVNGIKISGANTMIKNGVVHYIDGVFPTLTYTGAAPALKTPILPAAAAVMIAILVSYMGMASF